MKNYWLDEIGINIAAAVISNSLTFNFVGTKTNMDDWVSWALDIIRCIDNLRVRDALMWKYKIEAVLNEQEYVQSVEFVRLPWLI